MDLLARVGPLLNHLSKTRLDEQTNIQRLSSGLRINSAADDPSGLAISEGLGTQITGLQRGQENAQTAHNMLSVAEGSLTTITSVLQRIRQLVVEGASDFKTPSDLVDLQKEIDSLKQEINTISEHTDFNGLQLLDGSFDNSQAKNSRIVATPANPNIYGAIGPTSATNADGLGNPGPLISNANVGKGINPCTVEFQIIGFDMNAVDPTTGPIGGPGLYIQVKAYSSDPSFGAGQEVNQIQAIPENAGPIVGAQIAPPNGPNPIMSFDLANLTRSDVGVAMAFTTYRDTPAQSGQQLAVNDRGNEGTDVGLTIPQVSTQALGISDITVAQPTTVDPALNVPTGTDSNSVGTKDAMSRVDDALQTVVAARAVVGAQQVALGSAIEDAGIQTVLTQSSQSSIRDADIGAETTKQAKNTILDNITTDALASVQSSTKAMGTAFSDMISTGPKR
ncbi:MAG: flagellin [Candidatus Baltobacteraceae bacterium]